MLPVQCGKGNGWAERKGECLLSSLFSMAEALQGQWSDLRRGPQLILVPKVTWGKHEQNLPSTCSISPVTFLYWKKRTIKIGTTNSGLAEVSAEGSAGVDSWGTEVMTQLGWEAPAIEKTHQIFNKPHSLSLLLSDPIWGLTNSVQSSYGPLQSLDTDIHTAQEFSSLKAYF